MAHLVASTSISMTLMYPFIYVFIQFLKLLLTAAKQNESAFIIGNKAQNWKRLRRLTACMGCALWGDGLHWASCQCLCARMATVSFFMTVCSPIRTPSLILFIALNFNVFAHRLRLLCCLTLTFSRLQNYDQLFTGILF